MASDDRLDLRLPTDLKARLKQAAARERRSLSSFVIVTLESALSTGRQDRSEPTEATPSASTRTPRIGPKPTAASKPRPKRTKR